MKRIKEGDTCDRSVKRVERGEEGRGLEEGEEGEGGRT